MARIRSVKPEFWDSPSTAKASLRARLLYIAMWNWADDWGIGDANPRRLLSFAFPSDGDAEVEPRNFRHLAEEVVRCYGVKFYEVEGREYYEIPAWEEHQRTEKRAQRKNPPSLQAETILYGGTSEDPSPNLGTPAEGSRKGEVGTGEQGRTTSRVPRSETDAAPPGFDTFWDAYGKKVGKPKAIAAYRKALKKPNVTPELLVEAAAEYVSWCKAENKWPKYAKDPERWLNGERWTDELPTHKVAPKSRADEHMDLARQFAEAEQQPHLRAIGDGR